MKNQFTSSVIMATILICFSSILLIEPVESMKTIPSISIFLDNELYTAHVDPQSNGIVEINGMVRLTNSWPPGYSDITVDIEADAGNWEIETPSSIVFTEGNQEENITVIVHVPLKTSYQVERVVTISGNWYSESADEYGFVNSDDTKISVHQYFKFELVSGEHQGSLIAGEEIGFICSLINQGNGHDMIQIEIPDQADLMDKKIVVEISQDKFQLEEDKERQLTVNIKAENGVEPGSYQIRIRTISSKAELWGEESVTSDLVFDIQIESGMDDTGDIKSESSPFYGSTLMLISLCLLSILIFYRRRKE